MTSRRVSSLVQIFPNPFRTKRSLLIIMFFRHQTWRDATASWRHHLTTRYNHVTQPADNNTPVSLTFPTDTSHYNTTPLTYNTRKNIHWFYTSADYSITRIIKGFFLQVPSHVDILFIIDETICLSPRVHCWPLCSFSHKARGECQERTTYNVHQPKGNNNVKIS